MPDPLAGYPLNGSQHDEMFVAPGVPRPHWQAMAESLARAEPGLIRERITTVEREIRDSGLTYNVYADPRGAVRPWSLDALPLILPADEWSEIESAIIQRASLLNAVLADVYGPQTLLTEGVIPPELVVGHSGFQRAACGSNWPGGQPLMLYAADLARAPDGRWWVISDRTQAPSGAGYAVENRLIVSRVFPGLFRSLHTQRLAGYFAALRESLRDAAPTGDGPHLTVLLTPGPWNETYSEHSLLARYLGFTLVEGGDLTVRAGKVWLKGIDGLRRVHSILRRQDDDFCDPLELRADSALGIPGLLDCARRGTVLISNAIGSGVVESGALMGFLPALCQRLLGEPLRMPSVATWWLGEPAAFADAISRMKDLVFKSIDPQVRAPTTFGMDLDAAAARTLIARIRHQAQAWVAQETVTLSQSPVFEPAPAALLGARSIILRVFAVASRGRWVVMPGGLTRVAASGDRRIVAMQRGGASKDTWVLSPGPLSGALSLLQTTVGPEDLVRTSAASLSSRSAENLYWFGRYSERAEAVARLLRVALPRFSVDEVDDRAARAPLLALASTLGLPTPLDAPEAALLASVFDSGSGETLRDVLSQLQRLAFTLRDRLSTDHWRAINRMNQDPAFEGFRDLAQALGLLDRTVSGMLTQSGFMLDGMTRDTGWRFVSAGRRIERLRTICSALLAASDPGRLASLDWLLEFCDSTITYRSRYLGSPEWLPVLDLLLRDETNPRSVAYQMRGLCDVLERIEQGIHERDGQSGGQGDASLLPEVLRKLDRWQNPADLQVGPRLTEWLMQVSVATADLSESLSMRFFSHAHDSRRTQFAA